MSALFYFVAIVIILSVLLPKKTKKQKQLERIRLFAGFGFDKAQQQAKSAGITLRIQQYIWLISSTAIIGFVVSLLTKNMFLIAVSIIVGFFTPRIYLSMKEYQYRKEILISLPINLRFMLTKLVESQTVELALTRALPLMNGPTEVFFQEMLQKKQLELSTSIALIDMRRKIGLRKFDDFSSNLVMGEKAGFNDKTIKTLRESIEDIQRDIKLIRKLEIVNRAKIVNVYMVVFFIVSLPILFSLMEHNAVPDSMTYQQPIGQALISLMVLFFSLVVFFERKFMRLDLKNLK